MVRDILESCSVLNTLLLESCPRLTDAAFQPQERSFASSLRVLSVAGCPQLSESSIDYILRHLTTLQDLDISNCRLAVTERTFKAVLSHATRHDLRSLNLADSAIFFDEKVMERVVMAPDLRFKKALSLQSLNIGCSSGGVSKCSKSVLLRLLAFCGRNLQHFDCTGTRSFDDDALDLLVKSCASISGLRVSGSTVSDSGVQRLLDKFGSMLNVVDVSWCQGVSAETLVRLSALPHLSCLDASNAGALTNDFFTGVPSTNEVHLSSIGKQLMTMNAVWGQSISELKVCSTGFDQSFALVTRFFTLSKDSLQTLCANLTTLSLTVACSDQVSVPRVVEVLGILGDSTKSLSSLSLDFSNFSCSIEHKAVVESLFSNPNFPKLESLRIVGSKSFPISDALISNILRSRSGILRELVLRGCFELSRNLLSKWVSVGRATEALGRRIDRGIRKSLSRKSKAGKKSSSRLSDPRGPLTTQGLSRESEASSGELRGSPPVAANSGIASESEATVIFRGQPSAPARILCSPPATLLSSACSPPSVGGVFSALDISSVDVQDCALWVSRTHAHSSCSDAESLTLDDGSSKATFIAKLSPEAQTMAHLVKLELHDVTHWNETSLGVLSMLLQKVQWLEVSGFAGSKSRVVQVLRTRLVNIQHLTVTSLKKPPSLTARHSGNRACRSEHLKAADGDNTTCDSQLET